MAIEHESNTSLAKAVVAAGSQSAFGRLIGKRQSTINDWLKARKPLPAEHVLTVERHTGISRFDLRPDIYERDMSAPVPPGAPAAADSMAPQR